MSAKTKRRARKQAPIRAPKPAETPLFELPPPKPGEAPFTFEGTVSQMEACLDHIRAERPKTDGPPYVLTEAERNDILARHRFTADKVDYELKVCRAGLHDLENEVHAIAETMYGATPEASVPSAAEAEHYAGAAMAYARSLCELSNRMMRYAGRLEAYALAIARSEQAEDMVQAFERGNMGGRPFIKSEIQAALAAAESEAS